MKIVKCLMSFLFFLSSIWLVGCWDRKELNTLGIILMLGIDKQEEEFIVTAQFSNPAEQAGKTPEVGPPISSLQTTGKTVSEALQKMVEQSPKFPYTSHLRVFVLGEELARAGIKDLLDYISRNHAFRTDFHIAIAKDAKAIAIAKDAKAADVLNQYTALDHVPGNQLYLSLPLNEKTLGSSRIVYLDELISTLGTPNQEIMLPVLSISNPQLGKTQAILTNIIPPSQMKYEGLAIFSKDQLAGWLSAEEAKATNWLTDHLQSTNESITCAPEKQIVFSITSSQTKTSAKLKRGQPHLQVHLSMDMDFLEIQCASLNILRHQTLEQLEKQFEQMLTQKLQRTVNKSQQELQIDFLGFGETVANDLPDQWTKLKNKWQEVYPELPVEIVVDAKIRNIGTTNNRFLEK